MSTPDDERARLQKVSRSAVGDRLRQLWTARNLSQEALARSAGMDRSFYSNIETGAVSP
jgi:transcriptional regulator with XRE-family HTH domain